MNLNEIAPIILATLPSSIVNVSGEDCNFTVSVVCDDFEGKSLIERQKMVLNLFSAQLASGELHALTVNVMTPSEWEAKSRVLVSLS